MNKSEFLSSLARTGPGWSVTAQGMLRDSHGRCPVVAVAEDICSQQADGPTAYRRVADAIGLPAAIAEEIVFAADHAEPRMPIRDRLLEACRAHERAHGAPDGYSEWWWDQPLSVRAQWAEGVQSPLPFDPSTAAEQASPMALELEEALEAA